MSTPRAIETLVVAYGYDRHLRACLATLSAFASLTVVDNSQDPDVAAVVAECGGTYVDPGSNLGFAAGVNLGISCLRADTDVLLVNPDALVDATAGAGLARHRTARVAALAPLLVGTDGTPQRVRWPFPSPARALRQAVVGGDGGRTKDGFLVGAVLLLNRDALDDVGPFDERFFLYAEETDWQRRAVQRGWTVMVADDVVVTHVGGGTSSDEERRTALFHAGTETYIRKWHGRVGWLVFRAAVVLGAMARATVRPSDRKASLKRARLYLAGPRRVAGVR